LKLTSFLHSGQHKIGAAGPGNTIIELAPAIEGRSGKPVKAWARDMVALIEAGPEAMDEVRAAFAWVGEHPGAVELIPDDDVTWQPPVRRPTKICCLALNNSANADRILSGPKHPAIFIKGANALIGHQEAIRVKRHFGRVHPEPELAVVISKTAEDIRAEDAYDHVFGYTIHNDITSPTMRGEDTFHYRAIHPGEKDGEIKYVESHVSYPGRYKGSDTFSPLGPWLVTRDEIDNPHALQVVCTHLDKVVTEDNTRNLFHKVPEVLAFISSYLTLFPGDIVSMGTALKAAANGGRAVQNIDLQHTDGPVTITIDKIGTLSSYVRHVETAPSGESDA